MYDPEKDKWERLTSMHFVRSGVSVTALGRCVYAIGGWDGSRWLYGSER